MVLRTWLLVMAFFLSDILKNSLRLEGKKTGNSS
jgi:hypothetical protein